MARKAKKAVKPPRSMTRMLYGVKVTSKDGSQRLVFDVFLYRKDALEYAKTLRRLFLYKSVHAIKLIATPVKK